MNHWVSDMLGIFVFLFKCERGSLKTLSSRALYTSRSVNIIRSLKSLFIPHLFFFFFFLFFVLLAGEFSEATESFRQEVGVHFYASRSTSKVSFYKSHTCIEALRLRILTPSLRHDYYNFPVIDCIHTPAIFL